MIKVLYNCRHLNHLKNGIKNIKHAIFLNRRSLVIFHLTCKTTAIESVHGIGQLLLQSISNIIPLLCFRTINICGCAPAHLISGGGMLNLLNSDSLVYLCLDVSPCDDIGMECWQRKSVEKPNDEEITNCDCK